MTIHTLCSGFLVDVLEIQNLSVANHSRVCCLFCLCLRLKHKPGKIYIPFLILLPHSGWVLRGTSTQAWRKKTLHLCLCSKWGVKMGPASQSTAIRSVSPIRNHNVFAGMPSFSGAETWSYCHFVCKTQDAQEIEQCFKGNRNVKEQHPSRGISTLGLRVNSASVYPSSSGRWAVKVRTYLT